MVSGKDHGLYIFRVQKFSILTDEFVVPDLQILMEFLIRQDFPYRRIHLNHALAPVFHRITVFKAVIFHHDMLRRSGFEPVGCVTGDQNRRSGGMEGIVSYHYGSGTGEKKASGTVVLDGTAFDQDIWHVADIFDAVLFLDSLRQLVFKFYIGIIFI